MEENLKNAISAMRKDIAELEKKQKETTKIINTNMKHQNKNQDYIQR